MACNGLPAETYDRYVLGLLDPQDKSKVEEQIEQQCAICIRGVQCSMNLWLVYATTLEDAEPSADFRARLVRIADLSKRVLTFPKRHRSFNEPGILMSGLSVVCVAIGLLLVITWFAGRYSGRMDAARSAAEFDQLDRENARNRLELAQEIARNRLMTEKVTSASQLASAQEKKNVDDMLSKAQAEIEQYKSIFSRESELRNQSTRILETLSMPGAKLLPLRAAESSSSGGAPIAYAMIVENSRLIFVGSNLPQPQADRQFQIWLLRKEEPKIVSAGLVSFDDKNRAIAYYDQDTANITGVVAVEVTDEPALGSKLPSGPKVLETLTQ
jgi:anti-sigma-K factor RskA